jgi:hypothetical protein
VLYWKWDPIGVNDSFPYTADEYDRYGPQVLSALRNAASTDAWSRYSKRSNESAWVLPEIGPNIGVQWRPSLPCGSSSLRPGG